MEKFYLGMDIGTQSVGMACTDENYNLLRAKGRDLWAVRLFDEAKDASDRRVKRSARRRLSRRAWRIGLLQEVLAPIIEDKLFFIRLNNSAYAVEDKDDLLGEAKYALFADKDYSDKDFYKTFKTIFHLRKHLIIADKKQDARLYYLALHHIIKYRGHFLFEGESVGESLDLSRLIGEFNAISENLFEEDAFVIPTEKTENFINIIKSAKRYKDKVKECVELLGSNAKEWTTLLLGNKAKPFELFKKNEKYKDEKSFMLKDISDEELQSMQTVFEEDFEIISKAKEIFDFLRFEKILDGNKYISDAMIGIYEKHKKDLKDLKLLLKPHKELYLKVFKSCSEGNNYANYIGYSKPQKRKIPVKKCKYEDFISWLKNLFKDQNSLFEGNELFENINSRLQEGDFLPKILNADNGVFPHQINGVELDAILKNLVRDYPELNEKDSEGYDAVEKIKSIFNFRVPYYVGPLNTAHAQKKNGAGGNSWLARKREGRITPWNFDEIVDKAESNERFMRRMTNKCSYLHGKDVLPKASIIYQRFDVLNQLNKLQINEEPISVELKQSIFNELFLKERKVTDKKLKIYLENSGKIKPSETVSFSGKNGEFKCSMSSYISLEKVLGNLVELKPDMCENIILWSSLNTDKRVVEELIKKNYGEILSDEQIKQLKGLTFKEFGRLSKEFLCEISGGINDVTGEIYTILGELYNTNKNLNEILFDEKYSFEKAIQLENGGVEEVNYDSLQNLYVSPQVRRGIWQSLVMADEYVRAVGRAPDKIFIEVTREREEKPSEKFSRKTQLLEIYKSAKEVGELYELLNKTTDADLRSERLYLYFKQFGRCAYSNEPILLDKLPTNTYDVDHILPRTYIKDDSLDNKVLVLRTKNAQKSDKYPLPEFCRQPDLWKIWKNCGVISEKKYNLLTRITPLTNEDFEGFINKQLVVTNQTVKAVAELLKQKYSQFGTKIVYSKAKNVSEFKETYKIVKCRSTNDLHHARDAYLNIAVGNVYDTRFSNPKAMRYKNDDEWRLYNLKTLFNKDINGAWSEKTSLEKIKQTIKKTSMAVTRYTYVNKGAFYNETVYGKDEKGIVVPRKESNQLKNKEKYGGFMSLTTAYFSIVESIDKKGKVIKTIEAVPVLIDYKTKVDKAKLEEYFISLGLKDPKIIIAKLKIKTLVSVNGFYCRLAGVTGNQILLHNSVQWFTSEETDAYVNAIEKLIEWEKKGKLSQEEKTKNEFIMNTNRFSERKLVIDKERNISLLKLIIESLSKNSYKGVSGVESFKQKLDSHLEDFSNLSTFDQAKVLIECVRFMKCNAETANLALLKDGSTCGKLLINKKISDVNFAIIDQSPCGLSVKIRKV